MITELIRTWEAESFKLELFDTDVPQERYGTSRNYLAYNFYHEGKLIFRGNDFGASCQHTDDGDKTVAALLQFLSLKPGDTDPEYFEDYTPEQMEFAREHGETLWMLAHELEEGRSAPE